MICLDTYALWEIQAGNEKYSRIFEQPFVIADWTMVEFYRTLLREFVDQRTADYWLRQLSSYVQKVDLSIAIKALHFQKENKKANLSIFDCVGYIFAVENNHTFVTGDKEFKNRKNSLFIKK